MVQGHQVATPYVIATRDGHSYTIAHPRDINIPTSNPTTVAVFVRGKGMIMLGLDSIESIQCEPEVVEGRPSPGT